MAIFVIALHTCINPISEQYNIYNYNVYNFYRGILDLAVPFFFISSGFMLGLKIDFENIWSIKSELSIYLKRIFMLYCKWSLFYIPLAVIGYKKENMLFIKAVMNYIKKFLFVGEHYNSWPLWYLLSLCISIVLIYFMFKLSLSTKKMINISFLVYIIAMFITYFINRNVNNTLLQLYKKIFSSGRIWTGLFFITMGLLWAKHKWHFNKFNKFITVLNICIGIAGKALFYNFLPLAALFTAFGTLCLFSLCTQYNFNIDFNFKIFRKMSTNMYFIHMYVWTFYIYIIIKSPDKYGFDSFIFTLISSVILSYAKYYL